MRPTRTSALALLLLTSACLPRTTAAQAVRTTEQVPMRDGILLATDVYLYQTWTSGPVLLVRTPYDKNGLGELGDSLAGYGLFAVVIQDTRGRFASEGDDTVFRDDAKDGADSLAWILGQAWCDGRVGSLGGSALGITQYLLAGQGPPGLACQWVDVATPDLYHHAMFQGGVFRNALVTNWLTNQDSLHMLPEIVAHPLLDAFWDPVRLAGLVAEVNWPVVHFGGWYDIFAQGTLDAFSDFDRFGGPGATGLQKLVIGPWTHGRFFTRRQGELTLPAAAAWNEGQYGAAQLDWFNWCLKGYATGAQEWPPVRYYLMGDVDDPLAPGNQWRQADRWPPAGFAPVAYHLLPGGLLDPTGPAGSSATSVLLSDPANPVPTVCGANLNLPAGPCDQAPAVESRADVAVFSTPVLVEPVEVTGRIQARLFFSADVSDCDLMVRLTDVYPDGRSMLVTDGALRARHRNSVESEELLEPLTVVEGHLDLWSTAIVFNVGHRIRISISGSNSPRFEINPQTGEPFRQHTHLQTGQISLHHGPATPSALLLPVASDQPQPDGGDLDGQPDAGPSDPGPLDDDPHDAGHDQEPDGAGADSDPGQDQGLAADPGPDPDPGGCGCQSHTTQTPHLLLGLLGLAWLSLHRRKNS